LGKMAGREVRPHGPRPRSVERSARRADRGCARELREGSFLIPETVKRDGLLAALPGYVELLEACVADGASIGFLHPMPAGEAEAYWRWVADGVAAGDILMWTVTDDGGPIGTIQLHPASKPNGVHRAEVAKLMVHPR